MGGKKNALKIYIFKTLYKLVKFNTFVLEKDFEYSPFSRLISFKSCQAL